MVNVNGYCDFDSVFNDVYYGIGNYKKVNIRDMNDLQLDEFAEYLGHSSVETTMIYTHVVKTMRNRARSPLDTL